MSLRYRNILHSLKKYLPETQAIINRAVSEGFTLPSSATLSYINTLIAVMKVDGYWAKRDLILNFAYNDENCREFSMINWKNPSGNLATENNSYYNLFARSEEFDNNVFWAKVGSTVTANDVLAPNGTLTADRINITGATARIQSAAAQYTILVGHKYNFSVYVNPDTRDTITLRDQVNTPNGATFNLSTLVATNTGNGTDATITDVGGGWYRCSVNFMPATTNLNIGLVGSPTVAQLYLWGAQLTEGYGVKAYQQTVVSYSALQYVGRGFYGNITWNQSIPNTYNINTGYNPFSDGVAYTLNDASMDIIIQNFLGSNNWVGSAGGNTLNNTLRIGNAGVNSRLNAGNSNLNAITDTTTLGYIALNRINSTDMRVVVNSTVLNRTQTSTVINNSNQVLYSYTSLNQGGLFSYYSMGAEVVTEGQLFRTAYDNYLTNIGLTPIA